MADQQAPSKLNLSEIIEDMFLVLSPKEKDVIVQRFSLDNKSKRTLESIGQKFSVTRERIRQIEKIALGKLRRTVQTTKLNTINDHANTIISENGGLLIETKLISEILSSIVSDNNFDANIIKLALSINVDLEKSDKTNILKPFWKKKNISNSLVTTISTTATKILKKKVDIMAISKLIIQIRQVLGDSVKDYIDPMFTACLEIDNRLKRVEDSFGLMTWRHINPKSIRDKAYIVLKREKQPLHFVEIANKISQAGFDKKVVTTQAVHNELIRYEQFVLVGRGLYALKEFGYQKGTVADIIEDLLKHKSTMSKQEIIEGVLKQRYVKKGTISLNLQKNPQFARVGRAVYKLDLKKKK
ncbi:MAG: sigma factor-like helix-turn-helix DNA-binding protein [Candidatus Gracilibacteria bacterium]|jgi:hypothetical protein